MWTYVLKRVGLSALIVFCAVSAMFWMLNLIPGDPVSIALGPRASAEMQAQYAEKLHLNEPVLVRYSIYIRNTFSGNLGKDIFTERDVAKTVFDQLPHTIALALLGLGWAIVVGVPLGCLAAIHPGTLSDQIAGLVSVGSLAIPSFVISLWSILIFAIHLQWLPMIGAGESGNLTSQLKHLILPAFAIGLGWVGYLARMVRASMLEVMDEDYIRSAKAFGIPQRTIITKYALRVAILPTVTLLGIGFGHLLSGAVFAEIIFARPGVGSLIYNSTMARNLPLVQGAVLITTTLYVFTTLCSDLVVAWLDPRVRESL